MKLYIWGLREEPSIVSPECIASVWLVNQLVAPNEVQIITSNNTNISDIGKLPVLVTDTGKYHGYDDISNKILKLTGGSDSILAAEDEALELSLMHFLTTRLEIINKYNLLVDSKNYEKYTRKLYLKLFPFPMMYNQPSKLHKEAVEQAQLFGLGSKGQGILGFLGLSKVNDEKIPDTEYINSSQDDTELQFNNNDDDDDEKKQVAISSLHEKQLIQKSKQKALLKETKTSIKCMHLLGKYLDQLKQISEEKGFNLNNAQHLTPSEVLFLAYIHALTYKELPNQFLHKYLQVQHNELLQYSASHIQKLSKSVDPTNIRGPDSYESPSLWNEVLYQLNKLEY